MTQFRFASFSASQARCSRLPRFPVIFIPVLSFTPRSTWIRSHLVSQFTTCQHLLLSGTGWVSSTLHGPHHGQRWSSVAWSFAGSTARALSSRSVAYHSHLVLLFSFTLTGFWLKLPIPSRIPCRLFWPMIFSTSLWASTSPWALPFSTPQT